MGLVQKVLHTKLPAINWDMTPEYTFGTFESWGGKERVRSKKERMYYFFIDAWNETPKLCLMERGIKHARVIAEILAPDAMVRQCVQEQGKVALFERTFPINEQLKEWLITNVVDTEDSSKVVLIETPEQVGLAETGLPGRDEVTWTGPEIVLPATPAEMGEEDVTALVLKYGFFERERNPDGNFGNRLVDNRDGLTVTDLRTGLMWQRGGLDIMSHRSMRRSIDQLNAETFAGYGDWRLPTVAEALSLLEPQKSAMDQYLHGCFSPSQPFVFVDATRKPGGQWFVDFKQGRAFWSSGTIPGGFGRLCRCEKEMLL